MGVLVRKDSSKGENMVQEEVPLYIYLQVNHPRTAPPGSQGAATAQVGGILVIFQMYHTHMMPPWPTEPPEIVWRHQPKI